MCGWPGCVKRTGYERTLFETAYLTGAREGELLALRRPDLELAKEGAGKMVIRLSLSWARRQRRGSSSALLPTENQSGTAHDLDPRSAGRREHTAYTMNPAIPNSVAAIGRSVGSAQIAGEVPDQVTPSCRSQVSALVLNHSESFFREHTNSSLLPSSCAIIGARSLWTRDPYGQESHCLGYARLD